MEKYKVTINNKVYEVEIERIDENSVVETTPLNTDKVVSDSNETLNSPIQGNILSVLVSANKSVKAGDTLLVIEAMKLENEIVADRDGIIEEVFVSVGQTVDNNQPLIKYRG